MTVPPANPKIYHIVHVDKLRAILADGCLYSDAIVMNRAEAGQDVGTTIGMGHIKERRLHKALASHAFFSTDPLTVGRCVPFYFCPRSVMLYILHKGHPELTYTGGQGPIVHLEADLREAIAWAEQNNKRWAFTLSNAGAYYFEDRADLARLDEINWEAVQTTHWSGQGIDSTVKEGKQAEFLMEECFPWQLFTTISVINQTVATQVSGILQGGSHRPLLQVRRDWYY